MESLNCCVARFKDYRRRGEGPIKACEDACFFFVTGFSVRVFFLSPRVRGEKIGVRRQHFFYQAAFTPRWCVPRDKCHVERGTCHIACHLKTILKKCVKPFTPRWSGPAHVPRHLGVKGFIHFLMFVFKRRAACHLPRAARHLGVKTANILIKLQKRLFFAFLLFQLSWFALLFFYFVLLCFRFFFFFSACNVFLLLFSTVFVFCHFFFSVLLIMFLFSLSSLYSLIMPFCSSSPFSYAHCSFLLFFIFLLSFASLIPVILLSFFQYPFFLSLNFPYSFFFHSANLTYFPPVAFFFLSHKTLRSYHSPQFPFVFLITIYPFLSQFSSLLLFTPIPFPSAFLLPFTPRLHKLNIFLSFPFLLISSYLTQSQGTGRQR